MGKKILVRHISFRVSERDFFLLERFVESRGLERTKFIRDALREKTQRIEAEEQELLNNFNPQKK